MRSIGTRAGGRAAWRLAPCAARHRAFSARWRGQRRTLPWLAPLALVLLHPPRPLVVRRCVRIGVALSLVQHGTPMRGAFAFRPAGDRRRDETILRAQRGARTAASATPPRAIRIEPHRATVVERVLASHATTERQTLAYGVQRTRIERVSAYPRIAILPMRPQAAAASTAAGIEAPITLRGESPSRAAATGAPLFVSTADAMLPPRELARVTDHVLTQLDRKVLSYRERHGQI